MELLFTTNNSINISHHSQPTYKYTTTTRGLRTTFRSFSQIDQNNLNSFLEDSLDQLSVNNETIHMILQQLHQKTDADSLNSSFVDFMQTIIPLISNYIQNQQQAQNTPQQNSPPKTPNVTYTFKVPTKKATETVFDRHWKEHLKELEDFKKLFGHCNVSRTTKGYDQLGNWLSDQRRKLRRGKLTREQYTRLTEIGKFVEV